MSRFSRLAFLAALALLLLAATNSVYTIDETQQALVVRLGRPVAVEITPGLKFKLPFVDTVVLYDARQLPLEPPAEEIILGDQKRVLVSTYARFRIMDALRFYQALLTQEAARSQLGQIVSSSARRELGQVNLGALLSGERARITDNIRREVIEKAIPLGVAVVDVRILAADLPLETSQAIYDRMISERQREAKELRAQGFELAQQIQADAERERTVLLAEAQRRSSVSRGEGDAAANQLFADAFGKDPGFFAFFRSLKTYRQALAASAPTLVLSPDSRLLQYFGSGAGPKVSK